MSARVWIRVVGAGALAGASIGAIGQGFATLVAHLATSQDRATKQATEVVNSSLGSERWYFLGHLLLLVTAACAVCGVFQAFVRELAREPTTERRVRFGADLGWTALLVTALVLGRASAAPALVVPALPLPPNVAGWLASRVPPAAFFALPVFALTFALGRAVRHRRWGATSVALAAAALAVLGSTARPPARRARGDATRPNVLVLAADSVRPDHMSGYGYSRPTTPNLDALMKQGTAFDHAIAPLAMTTPSWVSILTGRYPHGHGVRHMFPDRRLRPRSMDALPRIAAEAGYRTAVFSDYAGDFFPIFDFGFSRVQTSPPLNTRTLFQREVVLRSPLALAFLEPLPNRFRPVIFRYLMNAADAERLADEVIAELDAPEESPFFLVAFFSTTHVPFAPRYPWNGRFTDRSYTGEHAFAYNLSSIADIARAERGVSPADARQLVGLYDGALASVDSAAGRILDALATRGLDANTIVVFLADHGENLFEPGQTTLHGKWFRGGDEASRVPLILRGPGIKDGQHVRQPVSLVDLAPTLADVLRLRPLERADGRPLAPALRGEALPPKTVFAETGAWLNGAPDKDGIPTPSLADLLEADARDDGQLVVRAKHEDLLVTAKYRALWDQDLKLVYEPSPTGANFSLYDLADDPHQERNIISSSRAAPLVSQMWRWLAKDQEREVDPRGHVVRRAD